MARITVEDCLENIENRFKLVLLASKRARQLSLGTEPLVEWENDKPTVVALREIAENLVNEEMMRASLAAPQVEEESEFAEDDLAAALHAEISRELSQTTEETTTTKEEPQVTESSSVEAQTTEPLPPQQEVSSSLPLSPLFGTGANDDTAAASTPTVTPEEEDAPSTDEIAPSSPSEASEEGDQGF